MTLTTAEKNQLRRRIGDTGSTQAFDDDELQDAYDEVSDMDQATVVLLEWLLADGAKLSDYAAGQASEKKSQVFDHLTRLLAYWEKKVSISQQVSVVGMRAVPPRDRDEPDT